MISEHRFATRDVASEAAAQRMHELLAGRLENADTAMFVVSGGTTPGRCFQALSGMPLDWRNVCVAMSDERWVPNDHEDSNERLLRTSLLTNAASDASVLPVFKEGVTAEERCLELQESMPADGFACALVGMGGDGHFASLFPDADSIVEGLAADNEKFYMPVRTAASPHPRMSMTLAALLQSEQVLLLFFGDDKFAVYEKAKSGTGGFPVAHLLQQDRVDVNVYWAP